MSDIKTFKVLITNSVYEIFLINQICRTPNVNSRKRRIADSNMGSSYLHIYQYIQVLLAPTGALIVTVVYYRSAAPLFEI